MVEGSGDTDGGQLKLLLLLRCRTLIVTRGRKWAETIARAAVHVGYPSVFK